MRKKTVIACFRYNNQN